MLTIRTCLTPTRPCFNRSWIKSRFKAPAASMSPLFNSLPMAAQCKKQRRWLTLWGLRCKESGALFANHKEPHFFGKKTYTEENCYSIFLTKSLDPKYPKSKQDPSRWTVPVTHIRWTRKGHGAISEPPSPEWNPMVCRWFATCWSRGLM